MFKKAVRRQGFVRIALMGPPGSGKTMTALLLAKYMGAKKIAVIDSERGSAKLYSHVCDFDVCELESFAVERYMEAIAFAQREGYDFLIIDSLSHAWAGKDGILEYKDRRTEQSRSKDSFGAGWRDASPLHNKFIDSILAFKGHVVSTLRTKVEHVIEEVNGKKIPRKIGLAPVQRDGVEYEFTLVGDFIDETKLAITKTRISPLKGQVIYEPGREMAETIMEWLNSAEAEAPEPLAPAEKKTEPLAPKAPAEKSADRLDREANLNKGIAILRKLTADGATDEVLNDIGKMLAALENVPNLSDADLSATTRALSAVIAKIKAQPKPSSEAPKPSAPPAPEKPPATVHPISPACEALLATIRTSLDVIVHDYPGFAEQARRIVAERPIESMPEAGLRAVKLALDAVYEKAVAA